MQLKIKIKWYLFQKTIPSYVDLQQARESEVKISENDL